MISQVGTASVGELFASDVPTLYKVPRYQRAYTWSQDNWESLFDDLFGDLIFKDDADRDNDSIISATSAGYFLGSIIVIELGHNISTGITEFEVVDGQQRLTTLSLLMASLYTKLNALKGKRFDPETDEDVYSTYLNLKNRLIMKKGKGRARLILQSQGDNLADYRALLAEKVGLESVDPRPKNAGNRRIFKAYRYFEKRIEEVLENSDDEVSVLCNLVDTVCSAVMVAITVSSHSDAYALFESLNNRGVPLSAVDLIKNSLLANLDARGEKDLDECFEQWQKVLNLLGDDYSTEERFFRQNYDAFRREANAPFAKAGSKYPLGSVATRSNLLNIYEMQIKHDPVGLLRELSKNATFYSRIILLEGTEEMSAPLVESLYDLSRVQGRPSYLVLLYLMRNKTKLELNDDELAKICCLLTRFFVRRNLTNTPPTRDLSRMFVRIVEGIEDLGLRGAEIYDYMHDQLVSESATDSMFEAKLRGPIYDINSGITRYILASLAKPSVTKEMRGLWERGDSGNFVWTIEHILPQGENLPKVWVDMIADGDVKRAKEIQSEYVHTLGNLTLTGYNSALGQSSYIEKRDHKDREGNSVGYKNGLNINAKLAELESWDEESIKERTDELVRDSMEAFAL